MIEAVWLKGNITLEKPYGVSCWLCWVETVVVEAYCNDDSFLSWLADLNKLCVTYDCLNWLAVKELKCARHMEGPLNTHFISFSHSRVQPTYQIEENKKITKLMC